MVAARRSIAAVAIASSLNLLSDLRRRYIFQPIPTDSKENVVFLGFEWSDQRRLVTIHCLADFVGTVTDPSFGKNWITT